MRKYNDDSNYEDFHFKDGVISLYTVKNGLGSSKEISTYRGFGWNYQAATFTFSSRYPMLFYGARGDKALAFIVPVNNNEIAIIKNDFGTTISHTTTDNINHTLTFTSGTAYGSSIVMNVISV